MARPIRIPRAFASRALMTAPVHVSRPASLFASTSYHPVACLTAQKRHISQQKSLRAPLDPVQEPVSPAPNEAGAHRVSHDPTNETKPLQKAIPWWDVRMGKDDTLSGDTVSLMSHDKPDRVLDRHWLRDGCQCSACVDPHSGQKNFGTTDVPLDLPISSCRRTDNGDLEIVWQNDFLTSGRESHTSTYSSQQVQSIISGNPDSALPRKVLWDKETINKDLMFVEYQDWMKNDEAVNAGMRMLHTHGILLIRNAPHSEESVISMSSRIGNLKETLYGRTWDVRSKPEAENIAYTSSFLGLHQDMLYLNDPPRLQLLHCLENSCEGGESLFSDAARAVYLIKIGSQSITESLGKRMIKYHYKKDGHFYENHHPVVNRNHHIRWSPPFQAPLANREYHREWVPAARKFQELLEKEEFLLQYKMNPGDCVIFDNLRVVHGRRAFDTSAGSRWLKGTYNANDVFKSKLRLACADLAVATGSSEVPTMLEQAGALNEKHRIWDTVDLTGKNKFQRADKSSTTKSKKKKPRSNPKSTPA